MVYIIKESMVTGLDLIVITLLFITAFVRISRIVSNRVKYQN